MSGGAPKEAAAATKDTPDPPLGEDGKPLSKNAQKRLRRRAEWEARRPEARRAERERRKANRARRREAREALERDGKEVPEHLAVPKRPRKRPREEMEKAVAESGLRIVLDAGFDDVHGSAGVEALCLQIRNSYGSVRRALKPAAITVVGVSDALKKAMAVKCPSADKWAVTWDERQLAEALPEGRVVYLSADADEVLDAIEPGTHYVIGGIVDRGQKKGVAAARANESGLPTARLPLDEHMKFVTRRVLTVVHVVQLLQAVHDSGGDWGGAMRQVIPARKGCVPVGGGKKEGPEAAAKDESSQPAAKRVRATEEGHG